MPEEDQFDDEIDVAVDNAEGNNITVNEYRSSITVGDVETLPSGSPAYVTNAGTEEDVILNFGLPKGDSGTTWGGIDGNIANQSDLQAVITALTSRIAVLEATLPVPGTIMAVLKSSMPGWLLCNGQAVSRTTYANLFNVIGVSFGRGDGSSTFNVPDYRGCFLRGLGGASASNMYTKQAMGAPDITGDVFRETNDLKSANGAFYVQGTTDWRSDYYHSSGVLVKFSAARSNSVYGAANEIRPVNYAVNFFIKY